MHLYVCVYHTAYATLDILRNLFKDMIMRDGYRETDRRREKYLEIMEKFSISILTQLFAVLLRTEIYKQRLSSSQAPWLHTRLTDLLLLLFLFCLAYTDISEVECSRTLLRLHCCLCILGTLLFFLPLLLLLVGF